MKISDAIGWAFHAHPTGISMQMKSTRNACLTWGEGGRLSCMTPICMLMS